MTFIFQQKAQPSAEKWTSFFVTEKNAVLRKVNMRGNRLMLRAVGLTEKELSILGVAHAGE